MGLAATAGATGTNAQFVMDNVTLTHGANVGPLVNAGADQSIANNTVMLAGTVTDDGLPNPPAAVSILWSQVSGPGAAVFASTNTANPSVTLASSGQYVLRLVADDGQVRTFDDLILNFTSPWDTWRAGFFTYAELTNATLSGASADPDHDGIKNLAEYAFGTNPRMANPLPVNVGFTNGIFTLIYQKNLAATDVTLRLEESPDLISWMPATTPPEIIAAQGQIQTMRVRESVTGSAKFWRISFLLNY